MLPEMGKRQTKLQETNPPLCFPILCMVVPGVWGVGQNGEWGDFGGSQAQDSTALNQDMRVISFQALF